MLNFGGDGIDIGIAFTVKNANRYNVYAFRTLAQVRGIGLAATRIGIDIIRTPAHNADELLPGLRARVDVETAVVLQESMAFTTQLIMELPRISMIESHYGVAGFVLTPGRQPLWASNPIGQMSSAVFGRYRALYAAGLTVEQYQSVVFKLPTNWQLLVTPSIRDQPPALVQPPNQKTQHRDKKQRRRR